MALARDWARGGFGAAHQSGSARTRLVIGILICALEGVRQQSHGLICLSESKPKQRTKFFKMQALCN